MWCKNKEKMFTYKKLIVLILAIFLGIPSISLGGSFVVSLIQGKTPTEAVQILAGQIDFLINKIDSLENRQLSQEKLQTCNFSDEALVKAEMEGGIISNFKNFDELITAIVKERDWLGYRKGNELVPEGNYQMWQSRLDKVLNLKEQYLIAKAKCEED